MDKSKQPTQNTGDIRERGTVVDVNTTTPAIPATEIMGAEHNGVMIHTPDAFKTDLEICSLKVHPETKPETDDEDFEAFVEGLSGDYDSKVDVDPDETLESVISKLEATLQDADIEIDLSFKLEKSFIGHDSKRYTFDTPDVSFEIVQELKHKGEIRKPEQLIQASTLGKGKHLDSVPIDNGVSADTTVHTKPETSSFGKVVAECNVNASAVSSGHPIVDTPDNFIVQDMDLDESAKFTESIITEKFEQKDIAEGLVTGICRVEPLPLNYNHKHQVDVSSADGVSSTSGDKEDAQLCQAVGLGEGDNLELTEPLCKTVFTGCTEPTSSSSEIESEKLHISKIKQKLRATPLACSSPFTCYKAGMSSKSQNSYLECDASGSLFVMLSETGVCSPSSAPVSSENLKKEFQLYMNPTMTSDSSAEDVLKEQRSGESKNSLETWIKKLTPGSEMVSDTKKSDREDQTYSHNIIRDVAPLQSTLVESVEKECDVKEVGVVQDCSEQKTEYEKSGTAKTTEIEVETNKPLKPETEEVWVSNNPQENEDNNNPEWEVLRKLETDKERYKAVRQRWGNLEIPDPNRNLTSFSWRLQQLGAKPIKMSYIQPLTPRSRKRPAEDDSGPAAKRVRTRSCTTVFECKVERLRAQMKEEEQRLQQERIVAFDKLAREHEREAVYRNLQEALYGRRVNILEELHYKQLVDRERLHNQFDGALNAAVSETSKQINILMKASQEVETFQKFYHNLDSSKPKNTLYLTDDEISELWETEKLYDTYSHFYNG